MKTIKRFNSDLYNRAELAIAHGALTNSKRPESFVLEVYPTHLKRGFGCYVYDTFGNSYIDFICGLGSSLFGYAQDDLVQACEKEIRNGTILSLGTELEIECAERMKEKVPFVERWRFLKTGSDACTGACIIARAHTKRDIIISENYHGFHPEFTSLTPPANGIAPHGYIASLKDNFARIDKGVAAVIVEPIATNNSRERIEWLRKLREWCTLQGALLIFDEVITGFRYPNFTVSQEHSVIPDLICMGKAIGGGMALSAIGGKKEIMEGNYFISSTFAGERLPLVSALTTMKLLEKPEYAIGPLWVKGQEFLDKFNSYWKELQLEGYPTRSILKGTPENKALFMQEACKAGILVGPSFFFIFPHMAVMDLVLSTLKDIIKRIELSEVKLEGRMPHSPFAEKVRGNK